jgi:hypothetical protein
MSTIISTPMNNFRWSRRFIWRDLATATLLNDGTVLIVGGLDSTGAAFASAEIYDPETGAFTLTTGGLNNARGVHAASF